MAQATESVARTRCCVPISMSGSVAWCSGWRPANVVAVGSRRWRRRPGGIQTPLAGSARSAASRNRTPRVRAPGGGRKKLAETDPELTAALKAPVDLGHPW